MDTKPIKLHRGDSDAVLTLGNTKHPYLKLPPRYEQKNLLGVMIPNGAKPKVYGILPGSEFVGKEGWVSLVYAFKEDDLDVVEVNKEDESPFEEE